MIDFNSVEMSANKNTRKLSGERKTPKRKSTFSGFIYTRNSKGRTGFKASLAIWERLNLESNGFFIGLNEDTLYAFMCDQGAEFTGKAVYYSTTKSKKEDAKKSRGVLSDKLEAQLIAVGVINETSEADIVDGKVFKQYLNLSEVDASIFQGLPEEVTGVYEFITDTFGTDSSTDSSTEEIEEVVETSEVEDSGEGQDSQEEEVVEPEMATVEDSDDDDF